MTDPLAAEEPAGVHDALAARESAAALPEGGAPGEARPATGAFADRRAELGLSIEDVANQLKFAPRQIEALEAGDFGKLPGRTFARGMLRSYARLLKIDPEPILAQFVATGGAVQAGPEQAVSLRTPIPFSEGGKHVNLIYAVLSAVIMAIVAFFGFEWYQERGAPPKLAFVAPAQDGPSAEPAREPFPPQPAATFASAGPAPVPETTAVTAAPATPAVSAAPVSAMRADGPRPPVAAGKRRIVIRFDKESWVEVKAGNGETLLQQMNPAGTEKVIEGAPPFLLTIGNAPNVRVTYNEQPVDLRPHFKVDVARLTLN
jgi:cytoskeleton protein RodZ